MAAAIGTFLDKRPPSSSVAQAVDLEQAKQIQAKLLPAEIPKVAGWDVHYECRQPEPWWRPLLAGQARLGPSAGPADATGKGVSGALLVLEGGALTLKEMARQRGLVEVSALGKCFRQHFGVTPGDYRAHFGKSACATS